MRVEIDEDLAKYVADYAYGAAISMRKACNALLEKGIDKDKRERDGGIKCDGNQQ